MIESNLLLVLALLPFAAAILAASMPANARNAEAWFAGGVMLSGLVILAWIYPEVEDGGSVVARISWLPRMGLDLVFRLDGLAWLFMVLVMGTGLLVVIYARYYLSPKDPVPRFYSFLLAFAGAMGGILLSGNIIMMVVFWEMTSITSFLLIGYWHRSAAAREGARTALAVTAAGGFCLLGGMLVTGHIVGSYELERVLASGDAIRSHPLYLVALALVLLGAFTKSAQVPFHFWLPGAMAAPTPVSAYLHSATMVKAGVFLLVRLSPALGGTTAWFLVVAGVGIATMLIGAAIALFRHDLKGLLAYSTISHLGLITTLAGIGSPAAIVAAIFHIVNHAVFKASLFMAAGIIDHETGTRDMRRLSGLFRYMPFTGALAIVSAAAMAGVPLLNGFLSKEMFFAEAAEWNNATLLDRALPWLAVGASVFTVAYSLRFVMAVFFGPPPVDLPREPHEPPAWMVRPAGLLAILCLLLGVLPGLTIGPHLHSAAVSVLGAATPTFSLKVWHGFNEPLLMSLTALVGGAILYWLRSERIAAGPEGPPLLHRVRAQRVFDWMMLVGTWQLPRVLYRLLGTQRLQSQIRILVLAAVAAAVLAGDAAPRPLAEFEVVGPNFVVALLWLVGALCAIGAAWQAKYHRFAALVLLGGAGLVTCATFAWFSAPDLAVTQLLVEIITTVLLLLGLRWLPKRSEEIREDALWPARLRRALDLAIAIACGLGVATIAFTMMTTPQGANAGNWFLRNSYHEGGGTNVVNVILVDFRAYDTFGEITVLAIVGLTVFALLRRFRPAEEATGSPEQQEGGEGSLMDLLYIPSVIVQWMYPAIIMLAAYLFFRGHDLPGGGFAAGVALAIGLLVQYLATNIRWLEARIRVLPTRWMGFGLLLAAGTGIGAWLAGYPFLTAHARYIDLPLIGPVPAATALLFDAGVFALVLGATVLMLIAIAHQSLRTRRPRPVEEAAEEEAG